MRVLKLGSFEIGIPGVLFFVWFLCLVRSLSVVWGAGLRPELYERLADAVRGSVDDMSPGNLLSLNWTHPTAQWRVVNSMSGEKDTQDVRPPHERF